MRPPDRRGTLPRTCATYWQEHRVWDRWLVEEEELANRAEHVRQRERTISELEAMGPRLIRVIDLCCGTGRVTYDILGLPHVAEVVAADISPSALSVLADRLTDRADACRLAIRTVDVMGDLDAEDLGRFDVVVCLDALHHLWDLDAALLRIDQLLAPGGLLIANYFAREGAAGHVIRKKGRWAFWRDYWIAQIACSVRFLGPVWNLAGRRGFVRMSFLAADDVLALVQDRYQVVTVERSDYLWFVARPAVAGGGRS
jgi:SAM-dependent methyltransferase